MRPQRIVLEDHGEVTSLGRHVRLAGADELPAESHLAGIEPLDTGQTADQRGLARARRPQQDQEFTGRHLEVDATERGGQAVTLHRADDLDAVAQFGLGVVAHDAFPTCRHPRGARSPNAAHTTATTSSANMIAMTSIAVPPP